MARRTTSKADIPFIYHITLFFYKKKGAANDSAFFFPGKMDKNYSWKYKDNSCMITPNRLYGIVNSYPLLLDDGNPSADFKQISLTRLIFSKASLMKIESSDTRYLTILHSWIIIE